MTVLGMVINTLISKRVPHRLFVVSKRDNTLLTPVEPMCNFAMILASVLDFLNGHLIDLLTVEHAPSRSPTATPRYYLILINADSTIHEVKILGVKVTRDEDSKYRIYGLTKWGVAIRDSHVELMGYWNHHATLEVLITLGKIVQT